VSSSVEQQWVVRREEELENHLRWALDLTKADKKKLRERAAALDAAEHATDAAPAQLRVAFLAAVAADAQTPDSYYAAAYHLACAGHVVFLVTQWARPQGLPLDFSDRVRVVTASPPQSLYETLPPADMVIATAWEQLPALYRSGRSFTYLASGDDLRDEAKFDSVYYLLPTRVLATTGAVQSRISEAVNRKVFLLAGTGAELTQALARGAARSLAVAARDPLRRTRPRVSLCMIARNESKQIQNCILSTYGVVDEVCLVDTGSTDDTIALAQRLGARVQIQPWQDDFSAPRNAALAMATGEWVLHLDADEELTPQAREALPELVRRQGVAGYLLPIDSVTPTGLSRNYGLRLFRRTRTVAFTGRVHENVSSSIARAGGRLEPSQAPIRHFGYTEDPMLATGKRSRNRHLLVKALQDDPRNPWYQYYLAVEDYLAGEPEAALDSLRTLEPTQWLEGEPAFLEAHALYSMGRWRDAVAAAKRGTSKYPHVLALWSYQATIGFAVGDVEACRNALPVMHRPAPGFLGNHTVVAATADYLQGCLEADRHTAIAHWVKAAPHHSAALRSLLRHRLRTAGLQEAIASLSQGEARQPYDMLLQALIDLQDWENAARLLESIPNPESLPGMGSVFWAQGEVETALGLWRKAGRGGWVLCGIAGALFGEASDVAPALEHVTPLQGLALQDLLHGKDSWRLAQLVPFALDLGSANVVQLLAQRAPSLAEAMSGYYRLYINP